MKNDEMRAELVQLGNGAHALATRITGNADVLEIANVTVMSRLHRARLALKEELTRHG
jgi:hypothetical protein